MMSNWNTAKLKAEHIGGISAPVSSGKLMKTGNDNLPIAIVSYP